MMIMIFVSRGGGCKWLKLHSDLAALTRKTNSFTSPPLPRDATKSILKQKFQYCGLLDLGTWTKKDQGRGL